MQYKKFIVVDKIKKKVVAKSDDYFVYEFHSGDMAKQDFNQWRIFPDFIIGVAISLPLPNTILTTPGGNDFSKAFNNGAINNTPCFAGLKIVVLPIIMAGINKANVSFKG